VRFVIVGGGTAGIAAAQKLRSLAPASSITLLEAEAVPHYLRPGLIEVLAGKKELSEITPYSRDWFEKRGIDYRLGEAAVSLDSARREVFLSSGKAIPYDRPPFGLGRRAHPAEDTRRGSPRSFHVAHRRGRGADPHLGRGAKARGGPRRRMAWPRGRLCPPEYA
jgi:NADPH-dependent 2,4-dienoyl-CoA reductase/sulfur reductase-like enzyme